MPLCRFTHLLHGGTLIDVCGDKDRFFWHHLFFAKRKGGRFSPLKGSEAAAGERLQKAADFEHRKCTKQAARIDRRA